MSVKTELEKATGLKKERGTSDAEFAKEVIDKITELPDEDWKTLSKEAQAWFNESVELLNDGKDAPPMPSDDEGSSKRTRRGAAASEPEPAVWVPVAGEIVVVTTKRHKVYEGEFIELDGDVAVVKVDGEEMEFTADRTESMVPKNSPASAVADKEPQIGDMISLTTKRRGVLVSGKVLEQDDEVIILEINGTEVEYPRDNIMEGSIKIAGGSKEGGGAQAKPPTVGDKVKAVTKRNKEVEGEVVEIDGNILVVETSAGDVEVDMDTAKSVVVVTAGGNRSKRGESTAAASAKPVEKNAKTTKAENGGVSVGARMREVICENLDMKVEAISKLLEKEKLSFKEATLKIVFKDVHAVVELLKQNKHFK